MLFDLVKTKCGYVFVPNTIFFWKYQFELISINYLLRQKRSFFFLPLCLISLLVRGLVIQKLGYDIFNHLKKKAAWGSFLHSSVGRGKFVIFFSQLNLSNQYCKLNELKVYKFKIVLQFMR